jgi:hypothetical protein
VKIGQREPTRKDMSDDEVYQYALKQKEEGNVNFKGKFMRQAEFYYSDALSYLDTRNTTAPEWKHQSRKVSTPEWNKLKITCYQNMSVALNSLGEYKEAILSCSIAITIDSKAVKAYY